MAMIHQWPLQEASGTTAQDVVGSADGVYNGLPDYNQNETFSSNPNLKSVLLNTTSGARDTSKAAYIDLLSGTNPSTLVLPYAQGSMFVFFKPIDDEPNPAYVSSQDQTSGPIFYADVDGSGITPPLISVVYTYRDANPTVPTNEKKEIELSISDGVSFGSIIIDLDATDDNTDTANPWYIVGMTWNTSQVALHVYNFDTATWTHSSDDNGGAGWILPAGNFGVVLSGNFSGLFLSGHMSHISIFDTALSDAEVEAETFTPSINFPCSRTLSLVDITALWDAAESVMTCTAELQTQALSGQWTVIEPEVKCNLELSGTRRELDSADNWRVIQTWLVTMSGRYSLPAPTDNSTIRFVIGNLTLQSYQYYQSPDDVITAVECERVQA